MYLCTCHIHTGAAVYDECFGEGSDRGRGVACETAAGIARSSPLVVFSLSPSFSLFATIHADQIIRANESEQGVPDAFVVPTMTSRSAQPGAGFGRLLASRLYDQVQESKIGKHAAVAAGFQSTTSERHSVRKEQRDILKPQAERSQALPMHLNHVITMFFPPRSLMRKGEGQSPKQHQTHCGIHKSMSVCMSIRSSGFPFGTQVTISDQTSLKRIQ